MKRGVRQDHRCCKPWFRYRVLSSSRNRKAHCTLHTSVADLASTRWFCEPAYEKLRGTEEGIVNRFVTSKCETRENFNIPSSRLYTEKAYVLSRGFVRRALEIPLGGLESEIEWMYFKNGKLRKVLRAARALIDKSKSTTEDAPGDEDAAVPRLTGGGIIALERTLTKLQTLLDSHPPDTVPLPSS